MTSPLLASRARVLALATGCLLALPGAATAATVTSDGTTITVTGTDAAENLDVHLFEGKISVSGVDSASGACAKEEFGVGAECPYAEGGKLVVDLRGGDDKVHSYLADAPARYGTFDLGAGDDFFEGYGSEVVQGGAGNDDLDGLAGADELDGGDGNDKVDGGDGGDVIRGGAGDDELKSDPMEKQNPDVIDGGPGRDSITDWMNGDPATAPVPTVTLDGIADDGFPGEGDNVINMEVVESYGALRFVGTDGDDIAMASEVGSKADLTGKGGADKLSGSDGHDTIDGGAGDDQLTGRFGNDKIVGGPGKDTIEGDRAGRCNEMHCDLSPGSSADTIEARDGEVDTISCGPGADTVNADAADVVAPDCETVNRGGTTTPGGGTTPGTDGPATETGNGKPASKPLAVAGKPTLRALLKSGLTVTVSGRKAGEKVSVALKKGRTVVAKGSGKADAAGTAKLKVRVTKAGRKALRKAKSAKLVLSAGSSKLTLKLKK